MQLPSSNLSGTFFFARDVVPCVDKGWLSSGQFQNNIDVYDSANAIQATLSALVANVWNVYIVKYSAAGNVQWWCTLKTSVTVGVGHTILTNNGEYMIVGSWDNSASLQLTDATGTTVAIAGVLGTGVWNGFVVRLGKNGTII